MSCARGVLGVISVLLALHKKITQRLFTNAFSSTNRKVLLAALSRADRQVFSGVAFRVLASQSHSVSFFSCQQFFCASRPASTLYLVSLFAPVSQVLFGCGRLVSAGKYFFQLPLFGCRQISAFRYRSSRAGRQITCRCRFSGASKLVRLGIAFPVPSASRRRISRAGK